MWNPTLKMIICTLDMKISICTKHYTKSVQIWSFFWFVFSRFWNESFSPSMGKYRPEKLRVWTLFTQWNSYRKDWFSEFLSSTQMSIYRGSTDTTAEHITKTRRVTRGGRSPLSFFKNRKKVPQFGEKKPLFLLSMGKIYHF